MHPGELFMGGYFATFNVQARNGRFLKQVLNGFQTAGVLGVFPWHREPCKQMSNALIDPLG